MKQNITTKQVNEVHPMDTLNLAVILDIACRDYKNDEELDNLIADRMTIGKMIEILEISLPTLHIDKRLKIGMMESNRYDVFQQGAGTYYADNLCDALWEAVKEVLKG